MMTSMLHPLENEIEKVICVCQQIDECRNYLVTKTKQH